MELTCDWVTMENFNQWLNTSIGLSLLFDFLLIILILGHRRGAGWSQWVTAAGLQMQALRQAVRVRWCPQNARAHAHSTLPMCAVWQSVLATLATTGPHQVDYLINSDLNSLNLILTV